MLYEISDERAPEFRNVWRSKRRVKSKSKNEKKKMSLSKTPSKRNFSHTPHISLRYIVFSCNCVINNTHTHKKKKQSKKKREISARTENVFVCVCLAPWSTCVFHHSTQFIAAPSDSNGKDTEKGMDFLFSTREPESKKKISKKKWKTKCKNKQILQFYFSFLLLLDGLLVFFFFFESFTCTSRAYYIIMKIRI